VTRRISDSSVRRLSLYLRALEPLALEGLETISSRDLAELSGTTAAQVRKDLSLFGAFGTRGLGYPVPALLAELQSILGLTRSWPVALIGAGRIGSALYAYPHFRARGFQIVTLLDDDPAKIGARWGDLTIRPLTCLEGEFLEHGVQMAILAVPAAVAQAVAERAVAAGARALLNFAPVRLRLPGDVRVNSVNLALELEALSHALSGADLEAAEGADGDKGPAGA
jgi:redox-sensing transcriptional repressor